MTIEELIIYGKKYLPSIEAKMLLSSVTGHDTLNLLNYLNEKVNEKDIKLYKSLIEARLNNIPTQYILGTTNFYGLELIVNKDVLIPRFETEELVENTINIIKENFKGNIKILDLCCGSGAIGLTLKSKIENSMVTMSDISEKALEISKKNKEKHNLDVKIINSDLFENIKEKFDVIISNPPYIKTNEEIDSMVKENEPSLALYGGDDGLLYYRRILKDIKNFLEDDFLIAFEIGCEQKDAIIEIVKKYLDNVNIVTKKDLSGRDRMIFITNKGNF